MPFVPQNSDFFKTVYTEKLTQDYELYSTNKCELYNT